MNGTRFILIFLVSLVFQPGEFARGEDLGSLYARTYRPTVEEFLRVVGPHRENPFLPINGERLLCEENSKTYAKDSMDSVSATAFAHGALLISRLEAVFPNGIYLFIGRDAALVADLVDAFYISQGQPGRVGRLHVSGATVKSLNDHTAAALLESNGFDPHAKRPMALVDATSFSSTSQSRMLLVFARRLLSNAGVSPADQITQTGVVSIQKPGSTRASWSLSHYSELPQRLANYSSSHALQVDSPLSSKFTYQFYWNASYDTTPLTQVDGQWRGRPTRAYGRSSKQLVLAAMFEVIQVAQSREFETAVRDHAKALGYSFPDYTRRSIATSKKTKATEVPVDPMQYWDDFKDLMGELQMAEPQDHYFSSNGERVKRQIDILIKNLTLPELLVVVPKMATPIVDAVVARKLTSKDHRRLWLYILSNLNDASDTQLKKLAGELSGNLALAHMLQEKAEVFLTSERFGTNVYQILVDHGLFKHCTQHLKGA